VSARHVVTNHRNQPVELHLESGVTVLGPHGTAELSEADLARPQLRVLLASRVITAEEVVPPPQAAPAAPEVAPATEAEAPARPAPAAEGKTKAEAGSPPKSKTRGS
jgi:hypothetical protein